MDIKSSVCGNFDTFSCNISGNSKFASVNVQGIIFAGVVGECDIAGNCDSTILDNDFLGNTNRTFTGNLKVFTFKSCRTTFNYLISADYNIITGSYCFSQRIKCIDTTIDAFRIFLAEVIITVCIICIQVNRAGIHCGEIEVTLVNDTVSSAIDDIIIIGNSIGTCHVNDFFQRIRSKSICINLDCLSIEFSHGQVTVPCQIDFTGSVINGSSSESTAAFDIDNFVVVYNVSFQIRVIQVQRTGIFQSCNCRCCTNLNRAFFSIHFCFLCDYKTGTDIVIIINFYCTFDDFQFCITGFAGSIFLVVKNCTDCDRSIEHVNCTTTSNCYKTGDLIAVLTLCNGNRTGFQCSTGNFNSTGDVGICRLCKTIFYSKFTAINVDITFFTSAIECSQLAVRSGNSHCRCRVDVNPLCPNVTCNPKIISFDIFVVCIIVSRAFDAGFRTAIESAFQPDFGSIVQDKIATVDIFECHSSLLVCCAEIDIAGNCINVKYAFAGNSDDTIIAGQFTCCKCGVCNIDGAFLIEVNLAANCECSTVFNSNTALVSCACVVIAFVGLITDKQVGINIQSSVFTSDGDCGCLNAGQLVVAAETVDLTFDRHISQSDAEVRSILICNVDRQIFINNDLTILEDRSGIGIDGTGTGENSCNRCIVSFFTAVDTQPVCVETFTCFRNIQSTVNGNGLGVCKVIIVAVSSIEAVDVNEISCSFTECDIALSTCRARTVDV